MRPSAICSLVTWAKASEERVLQNLAGPRKRMLYEHEDVELRAVPAGSTQSSLAHDAEVGHVTVSLTVSPPPKPPCRRTPPRRRP